MITRTTRRPAVPHRAAPPGTHLVVPTHQHALDHHRYRPPPPPPARRRRARHGRRLAGLAVRQPHQRRRRISGPWAAYRPEETLLHPERVWPHLPQPALFTGCYVLPALVLIATAVVAAKLWLRFRNSPSGLATRRDLEPLLAKQLAAKAIDLRPSLAGKKPKDIAPDDRGVLLGTFKPGRDELRSSWEDVILAIMAPRSGKTSGLAISAILRAPGPVLLTSNKAARDAYTATVDARAEVGTVWTLDP